jgi:hypothetical protein
MFRQLSTIIRELLDPAELHENTDRFGGISYNVVKWPVCRSVVGPSVVLPSSEYIKLRGGTNQCMVLVISTSSNNSRYETVKLDVVQNSETWLCQTNFALCSSPCTDV